MKVYKLKDWEYWYDRSYRTWYAIKLDEDGYQIGDAIDAYTKDEIIQYIKTDC